ncbi:MAG TPA: glycogen synthase GlgA [Vicinamibacterales bacterium]|nr:glycogen synthase GlgA [Vicinamibacterales bacterium]
MVGSEAVPYVKTGGLADVLGALPRALVRLGHDVDVVIPRYRSIRVAEPMGQLTVPVGPQSVDARVLATHDDGVRFVFIDQPRYFDREFPYGVGNEDYPDNAERFAFLCRAALMWAASTGSAYAAVHAHDWQAGLVPVLLALEFAGHPTLAGAGTVFTIHNLAYQGLFSADWLPRLGLGWELMHVNALEYWGRVSYLKGGITYSRLITTVSPRYAREIQTPALGFGFDGILRQHSADLVGILNGIDYDQWDPERDVHLPESFSVSNLSGKRAAKRVLLETYGLAVDDSTLNRPLVGLVSRLVDQKGFDLLAAVADELPRLDASFVLLGSGERRYEDLWRALASRYPDRIGARMGFDEPLAHLIEGGSDLFLMPSRFEPCGLNQMYSLRYATVPVVRATGGLVDTVRNYDPRTGMGNGFMFEEYSPLALLATLRRALEVYAHKDIWRGIQLAGMREDNSWDARARDYVRAYENAAA